VSETESNVEANGNRHRANSAIARNANDAEVRVKDIFFEKKEF
jgi:hypothetical protein